MTKIVSVIIVLCLSGCAWGTNLQEVQASAPTETRLFSVPPTPLVQCALAELERMEVVDKGFLSNYPGNHQHVYQLRHDADVERIAIYVPGVVWFVFPFPDVTAAGELAFRPFAINQTTVEYRRGGWPYWPSSLYWPAIDKCAMALAARPNP